ncbi:MAG: hypothetical protein UU14_C0040G0002 [Candidatus Roizmanbacteria bacterium GW2011_GWB1_40_7]|uniref:Uncharacterized protein n=1 Tax=Candidatus Roizmanbacteria bacterium GW2011_GWB1_40_7 TaxID=1618482 RepID=A0A0G0W6Q2_9BACT|nr:MAG: hypothetical protein UU14_C0040G0002 [Candidatus Roizmanbacteria bacterium GW2011_GWB1_40_7]
MFENDPEIEKLREKWPDMTYEEKIDKFLWKMVWFHHRKHIPGNPNQAINELTKTLNEASSSSEKLTKSIRTATWVAAIIGGLGVLTAIVNLQVLTFFEL